MVLEQLKSCFPWEDREPRELQLETVAEIIKAFEKHQYVLLNAPTGSGKSVIGITLARYFNRQYKDAYLLTTEKILQKQYKDDFSSLDSVEYLLGSNNYTCDNDGLPYEEARCHMIKPKEVKNLPCYETCTYKCARKEAKAAPIAISNYHYMIIDQDCLPEFAKMPSKYLGVYDEAHNLDKILRDYTKIELTDSFITSLGKRLDKAEEYSRLALPPIENLIDIKTVLEKIHEDNDNSAINRFLQVREYYDTVINTLTPYIEREASPRWAIYKGSSLNEDIRERNLRYCHNLKKMLERLASKINSMENHSDDSFWIFEKSKDLTEVYLKPIFSKNLFEASLQPLTEKKLFMSATLAGKRPFSESLGIDPDDVVEIHLPSNFPAENRKVKYYPISKDFSLNHANIHSNLPILVQTVDDHIAKFDAETVGKVMIHSGNYKINQFILEHSQYKRRMFAPRPETREVLIEEYRQSKQGILISPSLSEGLSLDDDLCRFQLILKVPYLNLGDKAVKVRSMLAGGGAWLASQAINKLVQSCGRGVRHKDDFCETIILDPEFVKLVNRHKQLFPMWFLDAVEIP